MKLPQIAVAVALSASAQAAVYKCEEGGQLVFSDRPCSQNAERLDLGSKKEKPEREKAGWEVLRTEDDMTDTTSCVAMSPKLYLGANGADVLFATLRITAAGNEFVAGIRSEGIGNVRAPAIHNNIDGLGLKVGNFGFREFQLSHGSYFVGFEPNTSGQIVEELRQADYFKTRLRYWPYDETYDSGEMTTRGFSEALEEMQACEQEG